MQRNDAENEALP